MAVLILAPNRTSEILISLFQHRLKSRMGTVSVTVQDPDHRLGQMHHDPQEMAGKRRVLPGWIGTGALFKGRCLYQIMSAKTKVTKTKTALKQETYNPSDLKHDLHCGFEEK